MRLLINQLLSFFLLASLSKSTNYDGERIYYYYTNLAELAIIDSNYSEASLWYKKAFKRNHPGFSDDYYNAFKVSVFDKDFDFTFKNAYELAERGMCLDFFNNYPILHQYPKQWKKLIAVVKTSSLNINQKYKASLGGLFNKDQVVRQNRDNQQKILETDSINYYEFAKLVESHGFPSEDKIGIECTENLLGIQPQYQKILLLHFAQNRFSGIDTLIFKALQQNQISPYEYAALKQFLNSSVKYYPVPIVVINETFYTVRLDDSTKVTANKNRLEVGLSTLDEQILKVKYYWKNRANGFRMYTPIDQFFGMPLSSVDSLFVKIDMIH